MEDKMDKRRFFSRLYIASIISLFVLLCVSKDVISADWTYLN
jgi:hypothetical protein